MNSLNMIGRLTADPELKQTNTGQTVCNFSIAVDTGYKDREHTSFFNCVSWAKSAETIHKYFRKGQRIGIESGKLIQERYEKDGQKRSIVKINVMSFTFIEKKESSTSSASELNPVQVVENPFDDGGVPF